MQVYFSVLQKFRTIKHSKAVLGGGCQRLAGGIQFVAIIANADLKLDWLTELLQHACAVENGAQGILPPPLVFLHPIKEGCGSVTSSFHTIS